MAARWLQLLGVAPLGLAVTFALGLAAAPAQAAKPHPDQQNQRSQAGSARPHATLMRVAARTVPGKRGALDAKGAKMRVARGGGLQCVPFARNASGISVAGNAHLWWDRAAGVYARGQTPEAGSVLSFQANRSMPLGHVAVVRNVINARTLEIDHANWGGPGGRKGGVARGVSVVDVSEANDWTAVRVALGRGGEYGSIYPANGFIYERPDQGGTMVAALAPAPMPELNAAPRDLRPAAGSTSQNAGSQGYASVSFVGGGAYEEVAEASAGPRRAAVSPRRKPVRARH